jgi:hypothetical protein
MLQVTVLRANGGLGVFPCRLVVDQAAVRGVHRTSEEVESEPQLPRQHDRQRTERAHDQRRTHPALVPLGRLVHLRPSELGEDASREAAEHQCHDGGREAVDGLVPVHHLRQALSLVSQVLDREVARPVGQRREQVSERVDRHEGTQRRQHNDHATLQVELFGSVRQSLQSCVHTLLPSIGGAKLTIPLFYEISITYFAQLVNGRFVTSN